MLSLRIPSPLEHLSTLTRRPSITAATRVQARRVFTCLLSLPLGSAEVSLPPRTQNPPTFGRPAAGHEAGLRSLRELIQLSCGWGIGVLTVFAFSSDNWVRPKAEVELLMGMFETVIKMELENFMREGVQHDWRFLESSQVIAKIVRGCRGDDQKQLSDSNLLRQ
ncbi:Alkyl transferase [Psidium guajava]|nr:Alkyl transferase [Psidium guajava]